MTSLTSQPPWTDSLEIQETDESNPYNEEQCRVEINITTFNVLAESYLKPMSHRNLPDSYANVAFDPKKRRKLLCSTLTKLGELFDILCLQEVDNFLQPIIVKCMEKLGFGFIYAPRGGIPIFSVDSKHLGINEDDAATNCRSDGCATFYKLDKWDCKAYEVLQFDDLAENNRPLLDETLNHGNFQSFSSKTEDNNDGTFSNNKEKQSKTKQSATNNSITGIISSYKRRNAALLVHLKSKLTQQEITIGNAHLYWNPGYEYVKLSQSHYLLHKIQQFVNMNVNKEKNVNESSSPDSTGGHPAVIVCGDMNSKPNSVVHKYFTNGNVDARTVAPWNYQYDEMVETEEMTEMMNNLGIEQLCNLDQNPVVLEAESNNDDNDDNDEKDSDSDKAVDNDDAVLNDDFITGNFPEISNVIQDKKEDGHDNESLLQKPKPSFIPEYESSSKVDSSHQVKYLLDVTLNKFTRWLRILGLDAELETDEQEKARTSRKEMILFEKCKKEKRILITTSKTLLQRKECPAGTYLVSPNKSSNIEDSLIHLLLLHGITLQPRKFLTRCVVCNGIIIGIHSPSEKKTIFQEYGFPGFGEDLDVYRCDKCGQGYWWSDAPQSSASRVKDSAARLLRLCIRGGIKLEGNLGFFDFIDVEKEKRIGEEERKTLGNDRVGGIDEVMLWLKDDKLSHNLKLQSAYSDGINETIPFTNVTSDFVGALDYIFFDTAALQQRGRLYIPPNFRALNSKNITNGHLLPSDTWPSDHLAVGAKLVMQEPSTSAVAESKDSQSDNTIVASAYIPGGIDVHELMSTNTQHLTPHLGCDCGCVPKVLSLFQMAELRKQARAKKLKA